MYLFGMKKNKAHFSSKTIHRFLNLVLFSTSELLSVTLGKKVQNSSTVDKFLNIFHSIFNTEKESLK